jgi:hypothetical protein
VYRAEEFTYARVIFDKTLVEVNRSFLGFYDIEKGYLCRRFNQVEASTNAALGTDDAVLDQGLEYLGKKGWRYILGFADVFFVDNLPGRLAGHVKNGADGVFCGTGNNQNSSFFPANS